MPDGVEVRAFPANYPYKWREIFLKIPLESTPVSKDGTFYLTGLPPGEYQFVCFYDANNNQLVEFGIDVINNYSSSPVIQISKDGLSNIKFPDN